MIALLVLAVVVFAFVLEPILRAKRDQVVLDAVALPEPEPLEEDEIDAAESVLDHTSSPPKADERIAARRINVDRPAGSDLS